MKRSKTDRRKAPEPQFADDRKIRIGVVGRCLTEVGRLGWLQIDVATDWNRTRPGDRANMLPPPDERLGYRTTTMDRAIW